jgi:hypothetical protein
VSARESEPPYLSHFFLTNAKQKLSFRKILPTPLSIDNSMRT